MAKGFVHTLHSGRAWVTKIEGDQQPLPQAHATKLVAVAAGRDEAIARQTEHVIHNEDGSIAERNCMAAIPPTGPVSFTHCGQGARVVER